MTNVTIPMPKEMLDYIDKQIKNGEFDNRSQFIHRSVKKMMEQREIDEILESSKEAKNAQFYTGDLKKIIESRKMTKHVS